MDWSKKLDAKYSLHIPSLEEVSQVLKDGLQKNFVHVETDVVDCPDLTEKPFCLAAPGISGSPRIADVGGPGNLTPLVKREKKFDLRTVLEIVGLPQGFAIGPGAGPYHKVGCNCEMMANYSFLQEDPTGKSWIAKVDTRDGYGILDEMPDQTTQFALMANLLVSEGTPGKVVKVCAKQRKGEENFVSCMAKTLKSVFGEKPIGMGGVFLINNGKAKIHIMPDFSEQVLDTDSKVDDWLKFYDMSAVLVCLSVFHSHDPGHNLRMEHTHCFSDHGEGGHYHYDVTPEIIEYEGYFTVAEEVYRIDEVEPMP